ncbi:MAG: helix-turn-helix domain-containing protein [Cyanobacteria bacterium]|nr:helix-turn-helix domain-containing protein [Cyanobacteriota bacterium]
MFNSAKDYLDAKRQRDRCIGWRRRAAEMATSFGIRDVASLLATADECIKSLSKELAEFERFERINLHGTDPLEDELPSLRYLVNVPGDLIKARKILGWSQEVLALQLDMHRAQVARYENELYASIRLTKAIEIANLFRDAITYEMTRTITESTLNRPQKQ